MSFAKGLSLLFSPPHFVKHQSSKKCRLCSKLASHCKFGPVNYQDGCKSPYYREEEENPKANVRKAKKITPQSWGSPPQFRYRGRRIAGTPGRVSVASEHQFIGGYV
jgi:hypothetical protein